MVRNVIVGLDSSFEKPTSEIADRAKAAGVQLWGGYIASKNNVGLAAPWTLADFDVARRCGATPLAFASGWDDPVACAALANAWNVRLVLDCEDGIRGLGSWTQDWVNAAACGIYGLAPVHVVTARFHIIARYPFGGCPGTSWDPTVTHPATPTGWQCQGTHTEFGLSVDRGIYDDWFATPLEDDMFNDSDRAMLAQVAAFGNDTHTGMGELVSPGGPAPLPYIPTIHQIVTQILAEVKTPTAIDVSAIVAGLVSDTKFVDAIATAVSRKIGAALVR